MDLNPAAYEPLYRVAKLISRRKDGGILIPHPSGTVLIDLEKALQDLDMIVSLAETCQCCGKRREWPQS